MNLTSVKIQKLISPALTLGLGGYQTYKNYTAAPQKDKQNVLIRDIIVLSGCVAGIGASKIAVAKILKQESVKKILPSVIKENDFISCLKKGTNTTSEILKECLTEAIITIGGICSGLSVSFLAEKLFPTKIKNKSSGKETPQSPNCDIIKNPDNGVEGIAKAYTNSGVKLASVFDSPFAAMAAYSITQEKGLENRLKLISYELIANTIIPTFTITTTAKAVQNIKNPIIKAASYVVATVSGLFIGNIAGNYFNKKVTEEVADEIKDIEFKPKKIKKAIIKKFFD